MVTLNKQRPSGRVEVPVDECIADEIQRLNDSGVITYGCCCGHGEGKRSCLVDISSKYILDNMGYTLSAYSNKHSKQGIYEIFI
ncbi:hypothetical protein ACQCU9_01930 [Rossellomorea marisflavi]